MRGRRAFCTLFAGLLALVLFSSCSTSESTDQGAQSQAETSSSEPTGFVAETEAEGYEVLGGNWEVAAITYEDKIVPVSAVDALADLYDSTFLGFSKDGTFEYRKNVFITRGKYVPYESKEGAFILKAETISRATIDDGKITETDGDKSEKAYLVVTSENIENTLGLVEIDSSTGKTKAGEKPIYFTKRGEKSPFDKDEDDSQTNRTVDKDDSASDGSGSSTRGDAPSGSDSSSTNYGAGNQNAVERAKQYLRTTSFSHDGLVKQLEYEGFSHEDATYGADACGADWMEQAVLKAKQYLQTTAFSESGLVDQLVYEGFTQDEAEHGVSLCGANWMEQAVKKARQYQSFSSLSYSRLVEQLEYEGFTHEQAVYGADNA